MDGSGKAMRKAMDENKFYIIGWVLRRSAIQAEFV